MNSPWNLMSLSDRRIEKHLYKCEPERTKTKCQRGNWPIPNLRLTATRCSSVPKNIFCSVSIWISYRATPHLQQPKPPYLYFAHLHPHHPPCTPHLLLPGPLCLHTNTHTAHAPTPQKGLLQWVKWVPDVPLQPPQEEWSHGGVGIGWVKICVRWWGGGI